ncbi:M6 family metalloprotease domain-containing protein [Prevotella sp. OH937_COT-195]|uniref:M6 family metalloprotease domain-containing protein n=1 Tax=Prevotella sp. OH937_COT-195 TaxID=2491051 RepID=UPI000F64A9D3|nr:M6 family metalloprotease domain-containing protein [Prevotella sp. OH937_COT-195]RRC98455.1 M6 family metalloprotease domain-containing protein [Prevotella sp. OH937_COT-195]
MKKLFYSLAMLFIAITATAIPAKKGVKTTLKLTDGTQVVAELRGDEYGHYYEAADGRVFVESETPNIFTVADKAKLIGKADERRKARDARRAERRKEFGVPTSYTGKKKGIIILVNFANKTFKTENNNALFQRIANEENFSEGSFVGSVHDYFSKQSNGNFDLTFDVVGPVTVSRNDSYYGSNDIYGNDLRPQEMVVEACNLVADMVDFKDYDWDDNGEVDQVYVLYAGKGEADGGLPVTIWPHEWELSATGKVQNIDGMRINTYACGPELNGSGKINGIGTLCHEFTHCLGLPDFYDTGYQNFGLNAWSVMDYGCYNNNGFTPCNYTGYERMFCGWVNPTELKARNTTVTDMKSMDDFGEVFIMRNPGHDDEYYILQNVQQKGWDLYAKGKGLLIMHIDYNKDIWKKNKVNSSSSRQRCTIFPADNYLNANSLAGDPFPYGSKNSFGNGTLPSAKLYNNNSDGTKKMNIEITDIKMSSDGTISFNFVNNNEGAEEPEDLLFKETFDKCAGTGGNDNKWKGGIANAAFVPDNDTWTVQSAYGADRCARFGTGKVSGMATTPEFTVNGSAVFKFKAAPWGDENSTLNITSSNQGITLSDASFALNNNTWNECTLTLTGNGTVKISFAATNNRFFLDDMTVAKEITNGISIVNPIVNAGSNRIYSIDGRYLGNDINALGSGLYIVGGKKIVK